MGDNAVLNAILRVYFSPSNYNNLNPAAPAPTEIDHFWEVQHIVDLIKPVVGDNWLLLPIGEFLDLASFVNDRRNLFKIKLADNQAKTQIPLSQYPTSPFIRHYLNTNLQGAPFGTVRESVRSLAEEMRRRTSTYPRLTRHVGEHLCTLMAC